MRRLSQLVAVLVCGAAAWALAESLAAPRTHVSLTAMTYNIGSAANIPLGPEQMAQIAQEIKDAQADVVGMTEVDIGTSWHDYRDMVAEIDAELGNIGYPMYRYYTPTAYHHYGYMVLVIWSRHPIVDTDFIITVPELLYGRKILRATIMLDHHIPVNCFMNHYYIGDGSLHQYQTDMVIDYVHSFDGPRVLMGDFNFTPDAIYYDQIVDSGLVDTCIAAGVGHLPTVGSGCCVVAPPRLYQIDFVFGTPDIDWYDAFVPDTTVSDHWPIAGRGLAALPAPTEATAPPGLLQAGWNLISLPLDPADPDPAQVFRDDQGDPIAISGNLHRYDGDSQSYRTYYDFDPAQFGELRNGDGYWLYLSAPTTLSYSGYESTGFAYDLAAPGWHLIGCPNGGNVPLESVRVTPQADATVLPLYLGIRVRHWLDGPLYWYDSTTGRYAACGFDPWHATRELERWKGYWVHTRTDHLAVRMPLPEAP